MSVISRRVGQEAARGGVDFTVSLTAEQAAALDVDAHYLMDYVDTLLTHIAALRTGADALVERTRMPGDPKAGMRAAVGDQERADRDFFWQERVLSDLSALDRWVQGAQDATLRRHAELGASVRAAGLAMGVSKSTAQGRRDRLAEVSPAELRTMGARGPVDHPGARVPPPLRSWSQPWESYVPVDITPEELVPGPGLDASVANGLAEAAPTPMAISPQEWSERLGRAVVPFDLDDRFWPLNPSGRTGRVGRNLAWWGENEAVDSAVLAKGQILLIQRDDVMQWGTVGGMVDPGEDTVAAMVRELREESGIDLAGHQPVILRRGYIPDWRATDHSWVCGTLGLFELDEPVDAVAGDDAAAAMWFRFDSIEQLAADTEPYGGLYQAHILLLTSVREHLNTR